MPDATKAYIQLILKSHKSRYRGLTLGLHWLITFKSCAFDSNSAWPSLRVQISNTDGHDHCWGRNGEFCVTLRLWTRTLGILT